MPKVYHDVVYRALRLHGSLGLSNEMPFSAQMVESFMTSLADGPTEIHKVTVARQVLRDYKPADGLFPTGHLLAQRERAIKKYGELLELKIGNL
jgi:acyl-CoA dehydrogenase